MNERPAQNATQDRRLRGVDFFRGLAAFGVIFIDSGLILDGNDSSFLSNSIGRDYVWRHAVFAFGVPFFFCASFYFAASTHRPQMSLAEMLRHRAGRLLLPYAIWTLVHVAARATKYLILHQPTRMETMFSDPIGLFLLGGSSTHLYFLPVLFVGLMILHVISPLARKISTRLLGIFWILALAVKILMNASGNGFGLEALRAFEPALAALPPTVSGFFAVRLSAVLLSFFIWCLPLTLMAFLLVRLLPGAARIPQAVRFTAAASSFAVSMAMIWLLPGAVSMTKMLLMEDVLGLTAFLLAWSLWIPRSEFVRRLGMFSFGIFLMHQLLQQIVQLTLPWIAPMVPPMSTFWFLLIASIAVFAVAWLILEVASRSGQALKTVFAIAAAK